MKTLHEMIFVLTIVLIICMNWQDYLVCVLVSLSCLVFISPIGCILIFYFKNRQKNQTVEADLDKVISKLQLEFDRLDKTREQLTNKILLTQLTEQKQ